jgi:hypothetical protein
MYSYWQYCERIPIAIQRPKRCNNILIEKSFMLTQYYRQNGKIWTISPYDGQWRRVMIPEFYSSRHWPYRVEIDEKVVGIAERWCYNNIRHSKNWRNEGKYFAFKNQQHSVMFALVWSV